MARGSIEKREGRGGASYRLTVDLPDDGSGLRRRHRETVRGSRKQADRRLRELLASLDADAYVAPSTVTVRELVNDRWLVSARLSVRPTTYRSYAVYARAYVVPGLGDIRVQRLTAADVEKWVSALTERVSARTARNAAALLGAAVDYAVKHGVVVRNVVRMAALPKPPRSQRRVPTVEEVERILADLRARGSWTADAVAVAMLTGLRRSEVLGLRWGDIDLGRALLHVRIGYHYLSGIDGGVEVAREPKSPSSIRAVELTRQTVSLLCDMHTAAEARSVLLEHPVTLDDYVFATVEGRPYRPDSLSTEFWRATKRLGLNGVRFHDLRHLHASLLLSLNVHPKIVSARLGHANIGVTLNLYSHLMPGMDRQAADALENALNNGHERPALGPAQ